MNVVALVADRIGFIVVGFVQVFLSCDHFEEMTIFTMLPLLFLSTELILWEYYVWREMQTQALSSIILVGQVY